MMRVYMSGGPSGMRYWDNEKLTQEQAKANITKLCNSKDCKVEFVESGKSKYIVYPDRADGPSKTALDTKGTPRKYSAFIKYLQAKKTRSAKKGSSGKKATTSKKATAKKASATKKATTAKKASASKKGSSGKKATTSKKSSAKKTTAKKSSVKKSSVKKPYVTLRRRLTQCETQLAKLQSPDTSSSHIDVEATYVDNELRMKALNGKAKTPVVIRLRLAPKAQWRTSVKKGLSDQDSDEFMVAVNDFIQPLFSFVQTTVNPSFIVIPPGCEIDYIDSKGEVVFSTSFLAALMKVQKDVKKLLAARK